MPKIEELLQIHCPKVLIQYSYILSFKSEEFPLKCLVSVILKCTLTESIQRQGLKAERIFFLKRASQPSSDVYTEAAFALLKSAKGNHVSSSYQDLCRDPLVLLKCSVNTWRQQSLRRILLAILENVILVNELMVSHDSEVADEYFASRNILVSWPRLSFSTVNVLPRKGRDP